MKHYITQIQLDGLYTRKDLQRIINTMSYELNSVSLPKISPVGGFEGVRVHSDRSRAE